MLNERKLTERELDKRTEAIQGLLSNKRTLVKKYGKDAEKVMYGIATKQAKSKVEDMNKDKLKELIQQSLEGKNEKPLPKSVDKDLKKMKTNFNDLKKRLKLEDTVDTGFSGRADYGEEDKALGQEDELEMKGFEENINESKGAANYFNDLKYEYQKAFRFLDVGEREEYKQLAKDFFSKLQVDDKVRAVGLEERVDAIDAILDEGVFDQYDALPNRGNLDFNDVLYLRGEVADLKDEIAQIYRDMEQEAEPEGGPVADMYGDLLNKAEAKLYRMQKQLDDYDMNESQSYTRVSMPRFVKDKTNPNFLNVYIDYDLGPGGSSIALGKETMTGQIRRESAAEAMRLADNVAKDLEAQYNLEDIEVTDLENGKVQVFAVSDDFINIDPNMLGESVTIDKKISKLVKEKLTKSSSVEDHIDDFKDSDAKQFKGKSNDKKIQMAVASFLSKQGKDKVTEAEEKLQMTYKGDPVNLQISKFGGTSEKPNETVLFIAVGGKGKRGSKGSKSTLERRLKLLDQKVDKILFTGNDNITKEIKSFSKNDFKIK